MRIAFFILWFVLPLFGKAQTVELSDKAEISIITFGPSQEELYSAFGHSAIRVVDSLQGFDAGYNYGIFDFNQPNFYLNFAKGFLYYKLGVYDYQAFKNHYIFENRYVHEQVLNLTQEQKQTLFDYLQINALPENQSYRYDYFYNNCATKVRDAVEAALGKDVVAFDGSYVTTEYTIRDLTDLYLQQQPWGDLGIDICLGLPMDKKATPYEYMFLPDYIESGFDHATIKTENEIKPLVAKKTIAYEQREEEATNRLPHPLYVFSGVALLGIVLSYFDLRKKRLSVWFDAVLFSVTGLIGLLLVFLWFFTDHNAAAPNLNVLWALPLHLVAAVALVKSPSWLKSYFIAVTGLSVMLLLIWGFLPQDLPNALIPVVIVQGVRGFTQYRIRSLKATERMSISA